MQLGNKKLLTEVFLQWEQNQNLTSIQLADLYVKVPKVDSHIVLHLRFYVEEDVPKRLSVESYKNTYNKSIIRRRRQVTF